MLNRILTQRTIQTTATGARKPRPRLSNLWPLLGALAVVFMVACSTAPAARGGIPVTKYALEYEADASYIGTRNYIDAQATAAAAYAKETAVAMPTHTAIAATVEHQQTVAAMNLKATADHNALALAHEQAELTREKEAIDVELTRDAELHALEVTRVQETLDEQRRQADLEVTRIHIRNERRAAQANIAMFLIGFLVLCAAALIARLASEREKTNREAIKLTAQAQAIGYMFLETSYGPIHAWLDTTGQTVYRSIAPPPHLIPAETDHDSELRHIPYTSRNRARPPIEVDDQQADPIKNNLATVTALLNATIAAQRANNLGPLVIPRWDAMPGWSSDKRQRAVGILDRAGLVEIKPNVGTKIRAGWISAERLLAAIEDDPELIRAKNDTTVHA